MKLFLHFDVNKTIFMADPVSGKEADYVFQCALAEDEQYKFKWVSDLPEMTYYCYVYEHQYPDGLKELDVKSSRKKAIENFLSECDKAKHPRYLDLKSRYDDAFKTMSNTSTQLLPGFYYLLEHLDTLKKKGEIEHYQIFIRTFGEDLQLVEDELQQQTDLDMASRAYFKQASYYLNKPSQESEARELLTSASNDRIVDYSALYKHWVTHQKSVTIQDDHCYWADNQKKWQFAKPFPYEPSSSDIVSIFFDDNIEPECGKTNILAPFDVKTMNNVPVSQVLKEGNAYIVNPLEAVEQFNYFVSRVEQTRKIKCANQESTTVSAPILHHLHAKLQHPDAPVVDSDKHEAVSDVLATRVCVHKI